MKKTLTLLLFSFTIMLAPLANAEDLIDGGDSSEILAMLKNFGEANLSSDDYGDPLIKGELDIKGMPDDLFYVIYFFDCSEEGVCDIIHLKSFLLFEKAPSLERVNAWNQENLVGKLDLDEERGLALSVPIILEGGITSRNLRSILAWHMTAYKSVERMFPEGTRL